MCELCGHARHGREECEEVTGYDHMNGDHECGCLGDLRWSSVHASVRRVTKEEADCFPPGIALVVTVEVMVASGRRLGYRAVISERDLADARIPILALTLDKAVERLEVEAEAWGDIIL